MPQTATSQSESYDLIILGSGIAGLAAARAGTAAGKSVLVVDKGRRIGGRVATRRADGFRFNHGAQFLTARGDSFSKLCDSALAAGALAKWQVAGRDAFCGTPSMRDFPAFLGSGLTICQEVEISHIERVDAGVCFHDASGVVAHARRAIITAPAPQSATLLADVAPELGVTASTARYAPCMTAMFGFDDAQILPAQTGPVTDLDGPVGWGVWESHRPDGDSSRVSTLSPLALSPLAPPHLARPHLARPHLALTVQGGPDWSAAHLEDDPAEIAAALLQAWQEKTGTRLPAPQYAAAHRWRYARVIEPAENAAPIVSQGLNGGDIAIAGDWLAGARIEDAFVSGERAFAALMSL
jgi:renalase